MTYMKTLSIPTNSKTIQDCLDHTLFPWSKQSGLEPMEIKKAHGVFFYTNDGKKHLDFSSQLINMNLGHGHPAIADAVYKQMQDFSFVYPGSAFDAKAELGRKLAAIAPGNLNKTFYTLGGAEANENAIKIARLYTGRNKIITLYSSYHGATYGAISVSGDPRKHPVESSVMPHVVHVENPYVYRCPWGTKSESDCRDKALEQLERIIRYEGENSIAAILLEGESGTSGCIKYPKGYWKGVSEIAKKYGILTISDEVMSGFGRTGKWFAIEHHGVVPDMITMAKGITGGYLPLGGVIVSDEIASFFNTRMLPAGLTNAAHPVCLAAASAAIDVYRNENMIENAATMGKYINEKLLQIKEKHLSVGDVRITGLLGCLELVKNKEDKTPMAPFNAKPEEMVVMNQLSARLKELGLFTIVRWNFLFIAPPLSINREEADLGIEIIDEALKITDGYCNEL